MGAHSTYTEAVSEEICHRIAEGEPLRVICRDERMPNWRTVYSWLNANSDFATRFARARDIGADVIAHECLEIADKMCKDKIDLGQHRLQIDTRLKLLAKWNPKKYGDKTALEVSGPEGGALKVDDNTRAAQVAALLAKAEARRAEIAAQCAGDISDLI